MQVCPQCYRETEDGHRFCGACGHQLNNNCPDCGFTNLQGQEFCGQCGQQILDVSTPDFVPPASEQEELINKQEVLPEEFEGPDIVLPSLDDIEMSSPQNILATPDNDEIVDITPPPLSEISMAPSGVDESVPVYSAPVEANVADEQDLTLDAVEDYSGELGVFIEILQRPAFEERVNAMGISDEDLLDAFNLAQENLATFLNDYGFMAQLADHDIVQGRLHVPDRLAFKPELVRIVQSLTDLCASPPVLQGVRSDIRIGIEFIEESSVSDFDDKISGLIPCSVAYPGTVFFDAHVAELLQPAMQTERLETYIEDEQPVVVYHLAKALVPLEKPLKDADPSLVHSQPIENDNIVLEDSVVLPASEISSGEKNLNTPPPVPETSHGVLKENPKENLESFQFESMHFEPERYVVIGDETFPNTNYEKAVASLYDEFMDIVQPEAKGKILQLIAEDGLGKSYILNIARSLVEPEVSQSIVWLGSHHYQSFFSRQLPLMTWYQMFYNTMGLVPEGHAIDDVQAQVTAFLNYLCDGQISEKFQKVLHDLLSVAPIEGISELTSEQEGRLEQFLFELLMMMSESKPVVIVLDNLQFADQSSLGLLNRLLQRGILSRRILIVISHTTDCNPSGVFAKTLEKVPVTQLAVANLTRVEMDKFLNDGPFGGQIEQYPLAFLENLYKASRGKPFYLEEALRWLHLNDYLATDPKTSKFLVEDAALLMTATLPDKVESLVSQRIEMLEDESRYLLQLASVLGECFSISMLMTLSQQEEVTFNESLEHLLNHGLIQPDATNTGRFRHGKIWKVVYQNIAPSLRQQFHQLVSEALEGDVQNHLTVSPYIRAYHAMNGHLVNRAIHYLAMSGTQCATLGSVEAANLSLFNAVDFFQHLAMEKLEVSHTRLYAQLLEDIAVINLKNNPEQSVTVLDKVVSIYRNTQPPMLLESLGMMSTAYENMGQFTQASEITDEMMTLVDAEKYPLELATIQMTKLNHLHKLGRYQEGVDLYLQKIDPVIQSQFHHLNETQRFLYYEARLCAAKILIEQLDERGFQWVEKTLDEESHLMLKELQLAYRLVRGKGLIVNGQYARCDKEAELLLNDIEVLEDSDWFFAQWGLLALEFHAAKGDWQNASDILLTIVGKANDARDYLTAVTAETWSGYLKYKHFGDPVEALKTLNDAIHKSSEYRFASTALLGWQFMSEIHLELGHLDEADSLIDNAREVAKKDIYGQKHREFELSILKARVIVARQEKETTPEAGKILEALWPEVVNTKSAPMIAHTAEAIGELYKTLAHQVSEKSRQKHLMRSVQFYQKANGIWLELENQYFLQRVQERTPRI